VRLIGLVKRLWARTALEENTRLLLFSLILEEF
jgi:hypothetical protein